jgi:hypothetical protein
MTERYFVKSTTDFSNDPPIGVRFKMTNNPASKPTVDLGGYARQMAQIEEVGKILGINTFDTKKAKLIWTQRNKVIYRSIMTRQAFVEGTAKLREIGYSLQETESMQRILR